MEVGQKVRQTLVLVFANCSTPFASSPLVTSRSPTEDTSFSSALSFVVFSRAKFYDERPQHQSSTLSSPFVEQLNSPTLVSFTLVMSRKLTVELVQARFRLPLSEAAVELGVCSGTLQRFCRRNGIKRWPARQVRSLDRRLALLAWGEKKSNSVDNPPGEEIEQEEAEENGEGVDGRLEQDSGKEIAGNALAVLVAAACLSVLPAFLTKKVVQGVTRQVQPTRWDLG